MIELTGESESSQCKYHRLLFISSGNHINVDVLNWFVDEVFPRLRRAIPELELDVVGQSATKIPPSAGVNQNARLQANVL